MSVLGWKSPWGGDESKPIPPAYWVWYRLYRWTRQAKHLIGWHDWRERGVTDRPDTMYAQRHQHCDWCGASKAARARRPR